MLLALFILVALALPFSFSNKALAHQKVDRAILNLVKDRPDTEIRDRPGRIKRGRNLFLNETFGGNGRTCGTCHQPTESFALSPEDIAARPQNDPLFVAENNPSLRDLENPTLMRQFGLIKENLDGFDQDGVMRGVPHTLGLRTSITPVDGFPLVNATGWSGDGAPSDGSLRNFVVGAIVQHFPKDLLRRPNVDFRLPTKQQMDAILEFQLSLGRQAEINLAATTFADANVTAGLQLFIAAPAANGGTRSCNACHANGGANDANVRNRQFATGTASRPTAPVCRGDAPGDGGFLSAAVVSETIQCFDGRIVTATFRGDRTFNTPAAIEAADTPPFFHNNSASTLEEAILHYTTAAFASSPAGGNNPFVLNTTQVNQLSALLRALNARENVLNGIRVNERSTREGNAQQLASVREALSETEDALRVLGESPIAIYQQAGIAGLLQQARASEQQAIAENAPGRRRPLLATAIARKQEAAARF